MVYELPIYLVMLVRSVCPRPHVHHPEAHALSKGPPAAPPAAVVPPPRGGNQSAQRRRGGLRAPRHHRSRTHDGHRVAPQRGAPGKA